MTRKDRLWKMGVGLATVAIVFMLAGCGQRIDRMRLSMKVAPSGPYGVSLTKKVAILPLDNRTQIAEPTISARFSQPVSDLLRDRCPQIRFVGPLTDALPSALKQMHGNASNKMTNQELVTTSRTNGLVALVGIALADVQVHSEPRGIWIFTYDDFTMDITAELVVFSAETGAKQLDTHITVTADISESDFHAFRENPTHPIEEIDEALETLVDDLADATCDALGEMNWFTQVVSVGGTAVTLSGGTSDGLSSGMRLRIFNGNASMESNDRTVYRLPGQYRGLVSIEQVEADRSTATIIEGNGKIVSGDLAIPVQ